MSIQSSVQNLASATGAILSSKLLFEGPEQQLYNMPVVASLAILAGIMMPISLAWLQRQLT